MSSLYIPDRAVNSVVFLVFFCDDIKA